MSKLETNTIDTVSGTSTLQVGSTNTTTITLGVSGDTINVPSGVTIANSGTATGFGEANTPNFYAYGVDQAVSDNTTTKLQFSTEVVDSDSAYDTSNYRFTVPSGKGGKYYVYAAVRPNTTTDVDTTHIYIYKNGSERFQSSGRSEYYETLNVYGTDDLSAGDYLEVYYYQGSGGSIDASGNASVIRSTFGGFLLTT